MTPDINVVKRNGDKEQLDIEKFHRVVSWACEEYDTGLIPRTIEEEGRA